MPSLYLKDLSITFLVFILLLVCVEDSSGKKKTKNIAERCKTCRNLVKKFHEGMEKTAKNHFGGGDTAWEESRLGKYARSETRLLEILERVCEDASKKESCHAMVEEYEDEIETFWFKKQSQITELEKHLCNDVVKVCCPSGKYGKNCEDCPGGASNPCFGRGKCKGDGTRGGKGKCDCDTQYTGDLCDECADNYYDAYGNLTCKACHDTCEDTCTDGTNKGCDKCKDGYIDNGEGCEDKDECLDPNICEHGKFCINKKGHHICNECDPACNGCTGTGCLSCLECNKGWKPGDERGCEDIDECALGDHNCAVGSYCVNNEGAYSCEPCNVACSGGCTDGNHTSCVECAAGYKKDSGWLVDGGCVDVDQCVEVPITCPSGQVCVNKPGPDSCEPCPKNCESCVSTELNGCLVCKQGYTKDDELGCKDIDECLAKPCSIDGEKCVNNEGSFKCLCEKGWVRTKDGDCKKKTPKPKIEDTEDKSEKDEL